MAPRLCKGGPVLVLTSVTEGEDGVTAIEYALMVAIVALLLVGAFVALFNAVEGRYGEVGDCLASGPVPNVCNPTST